jgi:hypothetical protein
MSYYIPAQNVVKFGAYALRKSKGETPMNLLLVITLSMFFQTAVTVPKVASVELVDVAGETVRMTVPGLKPGAKTVTAEFVSTDCKGKKFSSYAFVWKDKDDVFPAWYEVDFNIPKDAGDCHYEFTNLRLDGKLQEGHGYITHVIPPERAK